MGRRRRDSIQRKYLVSVVLTMVLVSVPAAAYMASRQARSVAARLEADGRELASYTAKLSAVALLAEDTVALDANVLELCKSARVLYALVLDKNGKAVTSRFASFNREAADVQRVKAALPSSAGALAIAQALRQSAAMVEVSVAVQSDDERIGQVLLGMSTQSVRAESRATLLAVLSVFALLCVAASLVLMWVSNRIVLHPLAAIAHTSALAAEGDLTQRVVVRSNDEMGQLGETFNQLVDNLGRALQRIQASFARVDAISATVSVIAKTVSAGVRSQTTAVAAVAEAVAAIVESLHGVSLTVDELTQAAARSASSTEQMSASIAKVASSAEALASDVDSSSATVRETSVSVDQVARGADELLAQVSSVTAALNQISMSIRAVEDHAQQAQALAAAVTTNVGKEGREAVQRAVDGMDRNRHTIDHSAAVMRELATRTRGIGDIVGVITGIADQTNLLALNASILAAQAGEHGRGFEVVAQEIRSLADNTSRNTKKIAELTATIQSETHKATTAMDEGARVAADGVGLVADVQRTLDSVSESSERSTNATRLIARSTAEQLNGAEQIATSAERMTFMATEIASATREQSQGAAHIAKVIEQLRGMSSQLRTEAAAQTGAAQDLSTASAHTAKLADTIRGAVLAQSRGSERINESLQRVQEVADGNARVSAELAEQVASLSEQAAALKSDLGRLTVRRSAEREER